MLRIVRIIAAIASEPGRWSRADLATEHGVSERQITKDLLLIRRALHLGISRQERGGYYFAAEIPPALVELA